MREILMRDITWRTGEGLERLHGADGGGWRRLPSIDLERGVAWRTRNGSSRSIDLEL
jgi:hypothetical protein